MPGPIELLHVIGGLSAFELTRHHFHAVRLVGRKTEHRSPDDGRYPSVTIIHPIKGLDPGLRKNLEAGLAARYPGRIQTLFVLDDREDPAYWTVRSVAERAKRRGRDVDLLLCGDPPEGMTGKLHAMMVGLEHATGALIGFCDSDARPAAGLLRKLVDALLSDPKAGASFAPVVVAGHPETAGDVAYALMLNGLYGPAAHAAAHRNGGTLPFIMGQFMLLRPKALEAIGGLTGTSGELVDDMNIGLRLHSAGFRNVMIEAPLEIISFGLEPREFASIYRRWIAFSRRGLPWLSFKASLQLRASLFWVLIALGVIGLFAGSTSLAILGIAGATGAGLSINRLHSLHGGERLPPGRWYVIFLLMLSAPIVYLQVALAKRIEWRGRDYRLGRDARLASKPQAARNVGRNSGGPSRTTADGATGSGV